MIELNELKNYLGTGLKIKVIEYYEGRDQVRIDEIHSLSWYENCVSFSESPDYYFEDPEDVLIKPLVYPLSMLTEEITVDGGTFVAKDELIKISGSLKPCEDFKNPFTIHVKNNKVTSFSVMCLHVDQLGLFNMLFKWHFDVFDWIGQGIAIDKSKLTP